MKETLKAIKWNLILASLLYLLLGLALLFRPGTSTLVLCYLVAGVITAYGVFQLLSFLTSDTRPWLSVVIGVICAAFGLFALLNPLSISDVISTILGLVILIDSILSLRRNWELRRYGMARWWIPVLLDAAALILGLIIIFNPLLLAALLLQVVGLILIYQSISDLWTIHRLSRLSRVMDTPIEGEVLHVEDDPIH